ncbi:MAG TPA: TIGR03435 family protein [Bryobacteraceae bacterium]|nr:TIGR03435 family protein [Bryobacteraceae bacterium]
MRCILFVTVLAVLSTGTATGQPSTSQSFEAADVHASASGTNDGFVTIRLGQLEAKGVTVLQLIMAANNLRYGADDDRIVGGPKWLDTTRFDIVAKARSGAAPDSVRAMLQALLAERFHLEVHKEDKPLPVYVLTVGKNLKLKESPPDAPTECTSNRDNGLITYACHSMTMGAFAEAIRQSAGAYFDRPLIDRTGLKGQYDITVKWTPKGLLGIPQADGSAGGISVFDALDKQLGLKAEKVMEPGSVFVVDRVDEKPAPNPPGTMEKLPPPITEFEVAEVRISKAGTEGNFVMKNGRLEATALTMRDLITSAYGIDDDQLAGGEKWIDTDHFDIIAKTAPTASFETLRTMFRTLLEQRFKLAVHNEERPMPAYLLTMPKKTSKLQESATDARGACKLSADNGLRTYTCTATTMAQFAAKLRQIAPGYIDHPVVDQTGLKGSYDFAVSWTGANRVRAAAKANGEGGQAGGAPSAAEPSNALTIFESIDRQLGLKLSSQKYPLPVLVIDHLERTPTEN